MNLGYLSDRQHGGFDWPEGWLFNLLHGPPLAIQTVACSVFHVFLHVHVTDAKDMTSWYKLRLSNNNSVCDVNSRYSVWWRQELNTLLIQVQWYHVFQSFVCYCQSTICKEIHVKNCYSVVRIWFTLCSCYVHVYWGILFIYFTKIIKYSMLDLSSQN